MTALPGKKERIFLRQSLKTQPGDLDYDGDIDGDDNTLFRSTLGKCADDAGYNPEADYDNDGCVTYADYRIWLGYYRNQ